MHNDLHLVTYLGLYLGFFEDWEFAKLWFNWGSCYLKGLL